MNFSLPVYAITIDQHIHFIPGDETYPCRIELEKFQYVSELSDNNVSKWREVFNWCKENLSNKFTWKGRKFFFVDKNDQLLFTLRWT